jgi:transposase
VDISPSDKPKGGQVGHKGDTLRMVETPDEIIRHIPQKCTCGASLEGVVPILAQKRQLFDLPSIRFEIEEHQIFACTCSTCGQENTAIFLVNIKAPVQYGNQTKAFSVFLNNTCQVSFRKISNLIENMAG